jgi:hypothetical protein
MANAKNNAARARRPHDDDGTQPPTAKKGRTGEQRLSLRSALSAPNARASGRSRSREKAIEVPSRSTRASSVHDPSALGSTAGRLMRRGETTCLSFGFRPDFRAHSKLVCLNCTSYYGLCLEYGKVPGKKKRAKRHVCDRPWDESRKNDSVKEVRAYYHRFRQFFDASDGNMSPIKTSGRESSAPRSSPVQASPQVTLDSSPAPTGVGVRLPESTPIPSASELTTTVTAFNGSFPNTRSDLDSTVDSLESDTGDDYSVSVPDAPTESDSDESNSSVLPALVDSNNVLTKEAAARIADAISRRDYARWPLQHHELDLLDALMIDGDVIRSEATQVIGHALQRKEAGTVLQDNELRLLGQLSFKAFKSNPDKKLSLPSFPRLRPIQIVCIPNQYVAQATGASRKKLHQRHLATAKNWMGHLPGDFSEALMISSLAENKKRVKELISSNHPNMYRASAAETFVLQAYVKLTDKQLRRMGRVQEYITGGLRLYAPAYQRNSLKNKYLINNFTTLRHDQIVLKRRISTGKGKKGQAIFRDKCVMVTTIDPLENICVKMESLMRQNRLLPSQEIYREHWEQDPRFKDSVAWSIKFDAGGGSEKGIISPVNVEHPQSQKHVLPILEFGGGVKDSDANMRAACFGKDNVVRKGIEAMIDRRCILLKVEMGGKVQVILVKNTDAAHNRCCPKAFVQNLGGHTDYVPIQPVTSEPLTFDKRLIELDVAVVSSLKLLRNNADQTTVGICFVDKDDNELGRGLFRESLPKSTATVPIIEQYLMAGVFTADLEALSRFFGHQGAASKYLCMFCLIVKRQVQLAFDTPDQRTTVQPRTLGMLKEDGQRYDTMMSACANDHERKKRRGDITRESTHSVTHTPMADVEPGSDVSPATMHIVLGMSVWMVKIKRKAFRRLEELEAKVTGGTTTPAVLRERVEETVEMCDEYENILLEQLKGLVDAVTRSQVVIDNVYQHISFYQNMLSTTQDNHMIAAVNAHLTVLRGQVEAAVQQRQHTSESQVENEIQGMNQLVVVRSMRDEMRTILLKHEGHASRVIVSAMSAHGIDENVYHARSLDGNHCMKLGEKGTPIMDRVKAEMKKVIKNEKNVEYLEDLCSKMKAIYSTWYRLMRVMKSVQRKTSTEIARFKGDTIALSKAIHDFVENEPVPGTKNCLPAFLKSHLLFGFHVQDFLERYENLGCFDEQSIESTHPQFNQLLLRYGNIRGEKAKRDIIRAYLVERADFILELTDEMVGRTSTTRRPNQKKAVRRVEASASQGAAGGGSSIPVELTAVERRANENSVLHPTLTKFPLADTRVEACQHCGVRLLAFGAAVHCHEHHSGDILGDLDSGVEEMMIEKMEI